MVVWYHQGVAPVRRSPEEWASGLQTPERELPSSPAVLKPPNMPFPECYPSREATRFCFGDDFAMDQTAADFSRGPRPPSA